MGTSPHAVPVDGDATATATTAFLDAFATSTQPSRDLQILFISAVVAGEGPSHIRHFLRHVQDQLDGFGRFNDTQLALWRWLVGELKLMEEHDTKRFNTEIVVVVAQLAQRIESRNDPAVTLEIDIQDDETDATTRISSATDSTIRDSNPRVSRESYLRTLQRLLSGDSMERPRDSIMSIDGVEDGSSQQGLPFPVLQRNSSTVSESASALLRSFTSMVGMTMEETFYCQICFENIPLVEGVELSACHHQFCCTCIKMYLELKITEGQVYPVCFHETESILVDFSEPPGRKACGMAILPSDIESLVCSDVWKKYLMFKFNKENQYGRQCPYCHESQVCAGPGEPDCICTACGKSFCFTHGNAHVDGTCADFELKQAEQEKLNRSAIAAISKPCPGCKSHVEKSGGCNHMKCVVCNTDFCWICGAVVDSNVAPLHFQWWNLRGCAGQQMEDVDAQTPSERFWMSILRVLIVIFLGPLAFVLTIVLTVVSCCCIPCVFGLQLSFRDCFTQCLNFIVIGLLLLVTGVCIAIAFILSVLYDLILFPYRRLRACRRPKAQATPPSIV